MGHLKDVLQTYSSVTSLEAVDAGLSGSEVVANNGLQDRLGELPELVVLILEKNNEAG